MKKKVIIIVLLICLITFFACFRQKNIQLADEIDNITINFNDKYLFDALVEEMTDTYQFDSSTDNRIVISNDEMSRIKKLSLCERRITDIRGLEKFTSLEELDLCNNSIRSISPLTSITSLKKLNLAHNKVNSISNINNLTSLEYLDLYCNYVSDLSGLLGMTTLEHLDLGYNNSGNSRVIANVDALNTLTNLKYLDFSYNNCAAIVDNINNLTSLEYLNVQNNRLQSIEALGSLVNLKEIYVHNNSITDISPLLNMPLLEVIYLRSNQIQYLTGIVVDDHLIWPNARVISIYNISRLKDNTLEVSFLRNMALNNEIELGYSKIYDTSNLPHIDENGVRYVTYEDFGARCDGVYDDTLALRAAHDFANTRGYEVRATSNKTYHLFNYYEDRIAIRTNTNWNNATFIIHDEEIEHKANRLTTLFTIDKLNKDNVTIENPNITLNTQTKKLVGIENTLETLNAKGYTKYYVIAQNANKKQFKRGTTDSEYEEGHNQMDCFQIDSNGNLLNDIQWDFETVTSMEIMPIQDSTFKLQNATFISIPFKGNHSADTSEFYMRGITITNASNIEISNITHTLQDDTFNGGYFGFFLIRNCSDMKLKNINFFSRKQRVSTVEKRASYELKVEQTTNAVFENVTSNGLHDFDRWGFMASQYCKDLTFKNVSVNRIDAHEGVYNLTVLDSYVGYHGFTIDGQGVFRVENSVIESDQFVTFRWDYGSFWNGDFYIKNCTHKYQGIYVFKFANIYIAYTELSGLHDYGYETHLPNMYFENFTLDFGTTNKYYFIGNFENKKTEYALPSYWPRNIIINGLKYSDGVLTNRWFKFLFQQNEYIDGNYSFVDAKLFKNDEDITNKIFSGEKEKSDSEYTLTIKKSIVANNNVTIYKNNKIIVNNETITDDYNYLFKEVGSYLVQINSEEPNYAKTGQIEFELEIATNDKITSAKIENVDKNNLDNIIIETNINTETLSNIYQVYVDNKLLNAGVDYIIDNSKIVIQKKYLQKLNNGRHVATLKNQNNKAELTISFKVIDSRVVEVETKDEVLNDDTIIQDDTKVEKPINEKNDDTITLEEKEDDSKKENYLIIVPIVFVFVLVLYFISKPPATNKTIN